MYKSHTIHTNTFSLFKITSLKEIRDNTNYKYLKRLYASNNLIESIAELNGSELLKNYPRVIDLQLNKLRKVSNDNVTETGNYMQFN